MTEALGQAGMVDVDFTCEGAVADRFSASPSVTLKMRATERSGARVHALAVRCQIRIEPLRRHYTDAEAEKVVDLFGDRSRWGQTLQPMQLAFLSQVLPGFVDECAFDLVLPLSYDVEVAAHKLMAGLDEGNIPLLLLFSGQVFTGAVGNIAVQPVPWHKETQFGLPVSTWREAMDAHFPGQAWVRMRQETYDRLVVYRGRYGLVGWDDVFTKLFDGRSEETEE